MTIDQGLDLTAYLYELGGIMFEKHIDDKMSFYCHGGLRQEQVKELVALLSRDNKGVSFDGEGSVRYIANDHVINRITTSKQERQRFVEKLSA